MQHYLCLSYSSREQAAVAKRGEPALPKTAELYLATRQATALSERAINTASVHQQLFQKTKVLYKALGFIPWSHNNRHKECRKQWQLVYLCPYRMSLQLVSTY
jgi:hypothetical protein